MRRWNQWLARTALAAVLSVAATATAQEKETGLYAEIIAGWNFLGDETVNRDGETAEASFSPSFVAGGALGWRFSPRFRMEAEMLYRTVALDEIAFADEGLFTEGDYSSVAISANALFDFNLFGSEKAKTYAGLGLSWLQEVDVDFERDGVERSFSGDEIGVTAMAGVNYRLSQDWDFNLELRYLNIGETEMEGEENAVGAVTADYNPISVMLGLGWRF